MSQAPLSRDPFFRRQRAILGAGGFRSLQLNPLGWIALLGVGLFVGTLVARLTPLGPASALPTGVVTVWVFLLLLDHHRERNLITVLCSDELDADLGAEIVAAVGLRGVRANYREDVIDDQDGGGVQRGIACRHADEAVVRVVMERVVEGRR